jgi:hypothetical protein
VEVVLAREVQVVLRVFLLAPVGIDVEELVAELNLHRHLLHHHLLRRRDRYLPLPVVVRLLVVLHLQSPFVEREHLEIVRVILVIAFQRFDYYGAGNQLRVRRV